LLENLIKNVTSPLSRFLSEIGVQDESLVRSLKDIK